jgi:hypothetical protein
MIDIESGTLGNLVVAVAHGKVTGYDYDIVLTPAIEAKLKEYKKIRLLYQLAEDFHGFSVEAFWDDAKLGLGHLTAFDAIAVVTDVHWIADAAKFFGVFLRCPVRVFGNADFAEAKEWVTTTPAWRSLAEV